MTVAEIASVLKLNEQTIRNWINDGKLPAYQLGRRVRIGRSDFQRFVQGAPATSEGIWDGDIPQPVVPSEFAQASHAASPKAMDKLR
jgi:excisionase family DNA binding protein